METWRQVSVLTGEEMDRMAEEDRKRHLKNAQENKDRISFEGISKETVTIISVDEDDLDEV